MLAGAARANQGRVQFLGLDIQDSDTAARTYEAEVQSPYSVGPAIEGSHLDFGVDKPPQTVFIDRSGIVVARFVGPLDAHSLAVYLSLITWGVGAFPFSWSYWLSRCLFLASPRCDCSSPRRTAPGPCWSPKPNGTVLIGATQLAARYDLEVQAASVSTVLTTGRGPSPPPSP